MKAIFVHLSGSKRGKTEFFDNSSINIGTDGSCNLRFDIDKNMSSFHSEIHFEDCQYTIKDLETPEGTLVNGKLIKEVLLHDGDLIECGENGPRMRFRIKVEEGDVCKPFSEMLADSMDIAREQHRGRKLTTAGLFFKALLAEAFTQSSSKFKLGSLLIFIFISSGIITLFFTIYSTLTETTKRIEVLEFESTVAEQIIKNFSGGICLIQCSFSLIDEATGQPLKTWGKNGRFLTYDYTGTGFLVSKDGKILTNRHIADPIWRQKAYFIPMAQGVKPRFEEMRAFFPNVKTSFPLKIEKVSEGSDVALLSINPGVKNIPVVELDISGKDAIDGEPVVLLGYPAGLNAIYAKIGPEIAKEISQLPFFEAAQELSNRDLIRPLSTQGHISDVSNERIVFDAQTTEGGSGGPLFNNEGKVVGISYGIFKGFSGANFGVPIKYALELLNDE